MKNQSQASAKRPAKPLHNQSEKQPAPPMLARQQLDQEPILSTGGEDLMRRQDGSFFLRTEQREYFNGKKWLPWRSSEELVGAGIPYSEPDPRKRLREIERPLSFEEARAWLLLHFIPVEFQGAFAPPLAGKYSAMPGVEEGARSIGLTPDALACHAIQVFLDFIAECPAEAARFRALDVADVEFSVTRKSYPRTPAADKIFERLYTEAMRAPFNTGLELLAGLRDLLGAHPGYAQEYEAISRIIGSAWALSTCAFRANDPILAASVAA